MANTLTRYGNGTNTVTRLPDLIDRLFQDSFVIPNVLDRSVGGTSRPSMPVNLFETTDGYVLHAALPGMVLDNLDIQVMGREVSIKGRVEVNTPENGSWLWRGIPAGEFYETFTLPVEVDGDKTEASYTSGILSITLPKAEHVRPKTIKVQAK